MSEEEVQSQLSPGYIVLTQERLTTYLAEHPQIVDLLQELPAHIKEFFPSSPLSLQVQHDETSNELYLLVGIHTQLAPEKAYHQLVEFDYAWWLEHHIPMVVVDVDFARVEEVLMERGEEQTK